MPTNMDPEIMKKIVKEAIKEWLEDKLAEFGWFSLKAIAACALAGLAWAWVQSHGWKL